MVYSLNKDSKSDEVWVLGVLNQNSIFLDQDS